MAGRCRGGAFVRHIVLGVGQEAADRDATDVRLVPAKSYFLQLVGQHSQLRVGQVAKLERVVYDRQNRKIQIKDFNSNGLVKDIFLSNFVYFEMVGYICVF